MSTYPCPFCFSDFLAPSEALLLNHIRLVHSSDPNFSIQCSYGGCSSVFKNFRTYQNHRLVHHSGPIREQNPAEGTCTSLNYQNPESDDVPEPAEEVFAPTIGDMQSYAARWILKTRESRSLTRSATQGLIEDVQDLVTVVIDSLQSQTNCALRANGIHPDSIHELTSVFSGPTTKPFQGVTSFHQQIQYCRNHFNLVVSIFGKSVFLK